jgi:hypothetical protein
MKSRMLLLLVALLAPVFVTGCASRQATQNAQGNASRLTGIDAQAARSGGSVPSDLGRVRAATASYQDPAAAQAAGFPTTTPPCLDSLPVGTMGHHYVDRRIVDDKVDVEHPEILLYAPQPDGTQKLAAVEYIIPYRIRARSETPPRIFDQDMKRQDALNLWYLHVWAWQENPAGLFADWNPTVHCAAKSGP